MITDEFSRYPVVEVTSSTSANATIHVLDKVISAFGIPKVIKSDNVRSTPQHLRNSLKT